MKSKFEAKEQLKFPGKFITFEGLDGSGKTTQSKLLIDFLQKNSPIPAIWTREIGGSPLAEELRQIIIYKEMAPMSELLLLMAARYDHSHSHIIPNLMNGKWVICDRFVDSTAVYQTAESTKSTDINHVDNNLSINLVYDMHSKLIQLMPDLTFLIDVEPETAVERYTMRYNQIAQSIRNENDKYERRNLSFYKEISRKYNLISELFKERIIRIDGTRSVDEIQKQINMHIAKLIKSDG